MDGDTEDQRPALSRRKRRAITPTATGKTTAQEFTFSNWGQVIFATGWDRATGPIATGRPYRAHGAISAWVTYAELLLQLAL